MAWRGLRIFKNIFNDLLHPLRFIRSSLCSLISNVFDLISISFYLLDESLGLFIIPLGLFQMLISGINASSRLLLQISKADVSDNTEHRKHYRDEC